MHSSSRSIQLQHKHNQISKAVHHTTVVICLVPCLQADFQFTVRRALSPERPYEPSLHTNSGAADRQRVVSPPQDPRAMLRALKERQEAEQLQQQQALLELQALQEQQAQLLQQQALQQPSPHRAPSLMSQSPPQATPVGSPAAQGQPQQLPRSPQVTANDPATLSLPTSSLQQQQISFLSGLTGEHEYTERALDLHPDFYSLGAGVYMRKALVRAEEQLRGLGLCPEYPRLASKTAKKKAKVRTRSLKPGHTLKTATTSCVHLFFA